jgi:NAD+ synthase (glutamine-hydrolysing)
VYANQVGGNDDLVFDGRSFVISPDKKCIGAAESFKEAILMVDLGAESLEAKYPFDKDVLSELYNALVLGTRDYVKKSKNDAGVVALSGGIDSAVVACIAADALGARNVSGVGMPSGFSSQGSVDDAKKLAENLGIAFHLIKIQDIYDFVGSALKDVIGWNVPGDIAGDVTEENVQARVRGILVMAMTNRVGPKKTLLISTGNKSEVAMGYCTLYGDTAGGFAPLSDVYKTDVYRLANYINRDSERIPQNTISKAPSAELRPDQKDEDSLPPYSVLDPTLKESIECQGSLSDMAQHGLSIEKVQEIQQTLNRNEFKRRQMPPGLKVTSKAFGTGRRWPIAAKFL